MYKEADMGFWEVGGDKEERREWADEKFDGGYN